ncbi:MAG: GNAT family N-acetyltransferase [Firmicutes bacterium]|nr:GNAT family N-acetyltransferase [Bacillota bacterium]
MEIIVKKYNELTLDELYDILKIRTDTFVVEQNCPYPECDGKDKFSYHMIGKKNNEIIAYLRILPKGISYKEVSIGRVLVKKDHRGLELGKQIMKRAIKFIREDLKENFIRISAQKYLLNFYINLGFTKESEVYLEDGIEHIEMLFKD